MHALGHSGIGSKSRRHIRWFSRRRIATDEGGTEMTTKSRPLARAFALALVLALPLLVVHAQPARPFRIGFLCANDASPVDEALRQLGYVEGRNAVFEVRTTQGRPDRAREQAADLVRAKVDVIVAYTNLHAFAAKQATSTIPIVVGFAPRRGGHRPRCQSGTPGRQRDRHREPGPRAGHEAHGAAEADRAGAVEGRRAVQRRR
jgi:hypothetical protein